MNTVPESNVTRRLVVTSGFLGLCLLCLPNYVSAQTPPSPQFLPPVNLGFTSFLDGGPPAGPGFYFQEYLQFYHADRLTDGDGHKFVLPPPDEEPDLFVFASLNQFIYQSDQPILLGGKWGLDLIIPFVYLDLKPNTLPFRDNSFGLGDILLGPYLQWDPVMIEQGEVGEDGEKQKRPLFMHRIELQTIFPTGKYSAKRELNPGSNFFSFNPYWSGTLFILPQWTFSTRFHYLWNSTNREPSEVLTSSGNNAQAGQAIHLNFATAYEVIPKMLHVGVNGYYLKQITDTRLNGSKVGNTREQVLGIGPGAVFHFSQDDHIFFNAYFETAAEQRPEGMRFILRWTHHF